MVVATLVAVVVCQVVVIVEENSVGQAFGLVLVVYIVEVQVLLQVVMMA